MGHFLKSSLEQPLNFRSPFINTRGGRQAPGSLCFGFQAAGYCHRIACCESRTAASVCFKYLFTQRQNKERAFKNTRAQLVAEGRAAAPPGSPVPVLTEVLASGLVGGSNGVSQGPPGAALGPQRFYSKTRSGGCCDTASTPSFSLGSTTTSRHHRGQPLEAWLSDAVCLQEGREGGEG